MIRDGTVTPQEREFQHYCHRSSYGDVVREGIGLSYKILRAVRQVIHEARTVTFDLGGSASTTQMTDAIIAAMKT